MGFSSPLNIQILAETMTRCGGNCSGCALSSAERLDQNFFDLSSFLKQTQRVRDQVKDFSPQEIESISVFLGQGDHFLIPLQDIPDFMAACDQMIPDQIKSKTVVFITASAIGKHESIVEKMDLFYQYSIQYQLPFFIQVVFDPKKHKNTKKFKEVYMQNILYFKEKCGMTEVTVNMGEDLLAHIKPLEFHSWIKEHGFHHIEMNWVTNQFTYPMWKSIYNPMIQWLKEWLLIYNKDPSYEINFIPFLARHFQKKHKPLMTMQPEIEQTLLENMYIDVQGTLFPGQMGLISNLTPLGQRTHLLKEQSRAQRAQKIISTLFKKNTCSNCEYQSVCSIAGSTALFEYLEDDSEANECPWNIKTFLSFFEATFIQNSFQNKSVTETLFNRNPVQNLCLIQPGNETSQYFDQIFHEKATNNILPKGEQ